MLNLKMADSETLKLLLVDARDRALNGTGEDYIKRQLLFADECEKEILNRMFAKECEDMLRSRG